MTLYTAPVDSLLADSIVRAMIDTMQARTRRGARYFTRSSITKPDTWRAIHACWNSRRWAKARDAWDVETFAVWAADGLGDKSGRHAFGRVLRAVRARGVVSAKTEEKMAALKNSLEAMRRGWFKPTDRRFSHEFDVELLEAVLRNGSGEAIVFEGRGVEVVSADRAKLKAGLERTRAFAPRVGIGTYNCRPCLQVVWSSDGHRGGFNFASPVEWARPSDLVVTLDTTAGLGWVVESAATPSVEAATPEHVEVGASVADVRAELGDVAAAFFEEHADSFVAQSTERTTPAEVFVEQYPALQSVEGVGQSDRYPWDDEEPAPVVS